MIGRSSEAVSGNIGTLTANASWDGVTAKYGSGIKTPDNVSPVRWVYNKRLEQATTKLTIMWAGQIDAKSTEWAKLLSIPITNGAFGDPYGTFVWGFQADTTGSQIIYGHGANVGDFVYEDCGNGYFEVGDSKAHQYIVVRDGLAISYYKDGVLFATDTLASNNDLYWSGADVYVNSKSSSVDGVTGICNIVGVWSDALIPSDVLDLYVNSNDVFGPIRSPAIWSFQVGKSASLSDNFNLSETFIPLGNYKSSLSDNLNLTENYSPVGKYNRVLSDNMNLSESTSPIGHFLKAISDTFSTTDVLSILACLKASTSDTFNLTDSITVVASLKGSLSDTLTLTDNLAALLKALVSLSDILTLTDSITYPAGQSASLSDMLSLTDSLAAKATLLAVISDIFSLTDTTSAIAKLKGILTDTFNLSDDITTKIIGNLTDTLTLTDSVTNIGHFLTTLVDTLTLTDSSSGIIHFKVSLSDTLNLSEQISALASYAATIIDSLNLTDEVAGISVTITGELTITFSSSKPGMTFTSSKPGITLS